jgi:hypothetical protein
MTDVPLQETAFSHWAAEITDHVAGFAQAALDATALALFAALILVGMPPKTAAPIAPGPMATATCLADCIETRSLTEGPLASGS